MRGVSEKGQGRGEKQRKGDIMLFISGLSSALSSHPFIVLRKGRWEKGKAEQGRDEERKRGGGIMREV